MSGLIHIYCGNGKGKTTAAVGLAVRAAGAGKQVLFVQFFKDGSSSEICSLKQIPGIQIHVCERHFGLYKHMNEQMRMEAAVEYRCLFDQAWNRAGEGIDVLILDEVISACNYQMVPETMLLEFLKNKPEHLEVILTGRNPSETLLELGDYVTEMRCKKHPLNQGIAARRGIEF